VNGVANRYCGAGLEVLGFSRFAIADRSMPDAGGCSGRMAQTVYSNGPINGNTDAWTINFGYVVSDTFNVANNGTTIGGASFGMWLFSGDTLTSAELSITSGENGGTSYFRPDR
jgi:hypothetical protein